MYCSQKPSTVNIYIYICLAKSNAISTDTKFSAISFTKNTNNQIQMHRIHKMAQTFKEIRIPNNDRAAKLFYTD